jgi:hypothetical protein
MSGYDIAITAITWIAFVLLVTVTVGVGYLTYLTRRDRRRQ